MYFIRTTASTATNHMTCIEWNGTEININIEIAKNDIYKFNCLFTINGNEIHSTQIKLRVNINGV